MKKNLCGISLLSLCGIVIVTINSNITPQLDPPSYPPLLDPPSYPQPSYPQPSYPQPSYPPLLDPPSNLKCIGCFGNPCSFCRTESGFIYTISCCNNCMGCVFESSNIQPPGLFEYLLSPPPLPLPLSPVS